MVINELVKIKEQGNKLDEQMLRKKLELRKN